MDCCMDRLVAWIHDFFADKMKSDFGMDLYVDGWMDGWMGDDD